MFYVDRVLLLAISLARSSVHSFVPMWNVNACSRWAVLKGINKFICSFQSKCVAFFSLSLIVVIIIMNVALLCASPLLLLFFYLSATKSIWNKLRAWTFKYKMLDTFFFHYQSMNVCVRLITWIVYPAAKPSQTRRERKKTAEIGKNRCWHRHNSRTFICDTNGLTSNAVLKLS